MVETHQLPTTEELPPAQDENEFYSRISHDPRYYMESCLWIRTMEQELIRLKLNYPQQVVYDRLMEQRRQGKPIRAVILKARREGVSTLIEGLIFHRTATHPNVNSIVIADDEESTMVLFRMSQLYYDKLPESIKPTTKYSRRDELYFADDAGGGLGSDIRLGTAGKTNIGRAPTFHCVHRSEVAFWKHADELILGLEQAVPDHPDTIIIDESTANGASGYFYDAYNDAKAGKSDYIHIFLPWFIYPDYRKPLATLESKYRLEGDTDPDHLELMPEEKRIKETYGLDDEQMAWRRWCIRNKCKADWLDPTAWDGFKREYPANDTECFLMSGRPVFPAGAIQKYLDQCKPPIARGQLAFIRDNPGLEHNRVEFVSNPKGPLSIWELPKKNHIYAVGSDVAEGLARGAYSVNFVLDLHTRTHVATWRSRIEPGLFAFEVYKVGKYYNRAHLGPESNNHGHATLLRLQDLLREDNGPSMQIYQRIRSDTVTGKQVTKLGWETNDKTRTFLIDSLVYQIGQHLLKSWDEQFILEAKGMQYDDKGHADCPQKKFKDILIAGGISLQMFQDIYVGPKPDDKAALSPDAMMIQREIMTAAMEKSDPYMTAEEIREEVRYRLEPEKEYWEGY